ncbi:hypothetical protein ARMGADRAFT_1038168 [Armillaria gallica]|uniref:Uncharacterized protein n=1 Tax=Armillaria gallica TaxID=47427 RepID=A0A2H3D3T7_ARMGA|nr:hypothetical protein ARMGADRAFT_1038168 [Armillaria gallica]
MAQDVEIEEGSESERRLSMRANTDAEGVHGSTRRDYERGRRIRQSAQLRDKGGGKEGAEYRRPARRSLLIRKRWSAMGERAGGFPNRLQCECRAATGKGVDNITAKEICRMTYLHAPRPAGMQEIPGKISIDSRWDMTSRTRGSCIRLSMRRRELALQKQARVNDAEKPEGLEKISKVDVALLTDAVYEGSQLDDCPFSWTDLPNVAFKRERWFQLWFIQRDANIRRWSVLGVDTPFESERTDPRPIGIGPRSEHGDFWLFRVEGDNKTEGNPVHIITNSPAVSR